MSQAPRGRGVDLDAVRDVVQELYRLGLRQIGRPEFHKPYPDAIDRDNPYPRGYRIPKFSLFSGEDGQSTLKHIARFTIQYGELANFENFTNYRCSCKIINAISASIRDRDSSKLCVQVSYPTGIK